MEEVAFDCVVPRPTAWISVETQHGKDPLIALLEGYNVASDDPPSLFCFAGAMPSETLESLKRNKRCSLSVVTVRDLSALQRCIQQRKPFSTLPLISTFSDLGLTPTKQQHNNFPPMVESSPIRMGCILSHSVVLGNEHSMLLLQVEYLFIHGTVLSLPSDDMLKNGRTVHAKVDAQLIQPVASLGDGSFGTLNRLYSLYRPKKIQCWESASPVLIPEPKKFESPRDDIEHNFQQDGSSCFNLGYNPMKAIIMPRPIGWISTYRKDGRIPHLAPYSFFCSFGDANCTMVAFSAYQGGQRYKDAPQDAKDMKYFTCNLVTEDLLLPMNLSSAEMEPEESEFELSQLQPGIASVVDAPNVQEAHVQMECEYLTTVEVVGGYSIVVGKVLRTQVDPQYLSGGRLDIAKLKPMSRLGYADEYGVVTDYLIRNGK